LITSSCLSPCITQTHCADKSILTAIDKAIGSSLELRSKKELIEGFIDQISVSSQVDRDWQVFVRAQKEHDLNALIESEKLKPMETLRFVEGSFRDGMLKTTGTDIDRILPPASRFGVSNGGSRAEKKQTVVEKLLIFFEKYLGLV
jgi:type I restriction enzyme, R subunit